MAIVRCPNGHKYDSDINKSCPYCAVSGDSSGWEDLELSGEFEKSGFEWDGKTQPIYDDDDRNGSGATEPFWNKDEYSSQPVVGWLVCIEGQDKGKDFCLHGAKCTIGRHRTSSVVLSDPHISREGYPALVVYDERKTHRFYLASGDAASHNNVELNGNMLLGQSVLNPYDEIRIEDTALVFVPFCGDDFYWED